MATGTGATYTILATAGGLGNTNKVEGLSRINRVDDLHKLLTQLHLTLKPETPRQDVTVVLRIPADKMIWTAGHEADKYLKVDIEVRKGAWSDVDRATLIEQVSQGVSFAQAIE